MITASMESLCAMAHTPMAKTLKFAQAKEMGSPTMDPLEQDTHTHTQEHKGLRQGSTVWETSIQSV